MKNEITLTLRRNYPAGLLIEYNRNYTSLPNPFELNLQTPDRILFYGSDSDTNSALILYKNAQLHLFHRKNRSWLDAGFLERTNTACLYDASGNTAIAGVKLFIGDRGEVVMTNASESEKIIPYLAFPAFLRNLQFTAECLGYSKERVEKVTGNILGCLETPPMAILNSLANSSLVNERKESFDFMDKISPHSVPLQEFVIKTE